MKSTTDSPPARLALGVALCLVATLTACTREYPPTVLLGAEYLEAPAIKASEGVFKPAAWAPIGGTGARAAAFYVTVAIAKNDAAQLRTIDDDSGVTTSLTRVDPPAADEGAGPPAAFSPDVAALLAAGTPVFWRAADRQDAGPLSQRYAVLIPGSLLSAFTRLQIFSRQAAESSAVLPVEIELVRDFFYFAIIGDSVQWGNGLKEADKMSALTAATIERETGRKVVQQRYAHSGARIDPAPGDGVCEFSCFGEVPIVYTSILRQADQIQRPDLVDLILLDGCINDVKVGLFLNPATPETEITELTTHFCNDEMTVLLRKARALAPQASIVVAGYYQIVSEMSDPSALRMWEKARGDKPSTDTSSEELVAMLTQHAVLFRDTCHAALAESVAQVNAETGATQIAFADPGFGPEHAVFTPQRWLWSLSEEATIPGEKTGGLQLFPEDALAPDRARLCFEGLAADSPLSCVYVSVGHPNPLGAMAYAAAIEARLRDLGVLAP